jgi:hypothetical protein
MASGSWGNSREPLKRIAPAVGRSERTIRVRSGLDLRCDRVFLLRWIRTSLLTSDLSYPVAYVMTVRPEVALTTDEAGRANLAESIRRRFAALGGVDLPDLPREPMRQPPQFRK